jgi:sialidase-1
MKHAIRWALAALLITTIGTSAFGQAAGSAKKEVAGMQRVLTLPPGEGNPRNSEGDFIQLKDGRILFVYTHFTGSASDHGAAHLAGRFSSDGGRTWTQEDQVILPNEGGLNIMSVSLLRLANGKIALFYLLKESKSDCRPCLRISTDEAKTWSAPTHCFDTVGYFVVNNDRVIQLKSGRLVIPAARHSVGKEAFRAGEGIAYLSDDSGKTWRASETVLAPPKNSGSGLQEPAVIELKDGRLMMLFRTDQGCQYRSFSADGGVTWSPVEPTNIISPLSPATLERIPKTGDILLVWNNHKDIDPSLRGKRTPFTAAISRDEGQTWKHVRNLEDDPNGWYCYTAMEFVGDTVLLGLCAGDRRKGGLNVTEILRVDIEALCRPVAK